MCSINQQEDCSMVNNGCHNSLLKHSLAAVLFWKGLFFCSAVSDLHKPWLHTDCQTCHVHLLKISSVLVVNFSVLSNMGVASVCLLEQVTTISLALSTCNSREELLHCSTNSSRTELRWCKGPESREKRAVTVWVGRHAIIHVEDEEQRWEDAAQRGASRAEGKMLDVIDQHSLWPAGKKVTDPSQSLHHKGD